jgi:hypothetical protein
MSFYATEVAKQAKARLEMECGGFKAGLRRARRLKDTGRAHGLPPGELVPVYPVDMFPGCPEEWNRGAGSYVCPVEPGWGLWFDWTRNDKLNTAVLASVKGMNPITGEKMDSLALDQYVEKCPKHGIPFEGDQRFCPECGYKWPPQSFVSYPNTLWWDGFRQPDGTVRQFFFSEDDARDVASMVIGEQNVVPAFGFAFFSTKDPRVPPREETSRGDYSGIVLASCSSSPMAFGSGGSKGFSPSLECLGDELESLTFGGGDLDLDAPVECQVDDLNIADEEPVTYSADDIPVKGANVSESKTLSSTSPTKGGRRKGGRRTARRASASRGILRGARQIARPAVEKKKVAVGAGAEIRQDLRSDPLGVDGWKQEPAAVIRLYFTFKPQFKEIVAAGIKDVDGDDKGFMKDLPVGDD